MNLVIDIGNTLTKLAVFDKNTLLETFIVKNIDNNLIDSFFQKYTIDACIFSSVVINQATEDLLKKYNFLQLTHLTQLPLTINYKTPETLGIDRISAVVGAKSSYKETNLLVIDIGTCVTYDFLTSKGEYKGGSISPGFNMRFKALHNFTGKLPLVNYHKDKITLIGNSTEKSIVSGVYNGMKNEINGIINDYISQYATLKIVVTGGDINLFDLEPKNRIFADEFLVLKGLNEILIYNEK
jgi:type III pantothenate kinase